jgi:hypothetical protein
VVARKVDGRQSAKRPFTDISLHPDRLRISQRIEDLEVYFLDLNLEVPMILELIANPLPQFLRIVIESGPSHGVGGLG